MIRCSWVVWQPLWHNEHHSTHTAPNSNRYQRKILISHEQQVVTIEKVERTIHSKSHHIALKNIASRDWCLSRNGDRLELIVRIDNAPLPIENFMTHNVGT